MDKLKSLWKVVLIAAVSVIIPIVSNYAMLLPGAYIDQSTVSGSVLMRVLFYSMQTGLAILFTVFVMRCSIGDMGHHADKDKELAWSGYCSYVRQYDSNIKRVCGYFLLYKVTPIK